MNYYVVKFQKDCSVEAVPDCWVSMDEEGVTCAWPPVRARSKLQYAITKPLSPDAEWKRFSITILRKCGMLSYYCIQQFLV